MGSRVDSSCPISPIYDKTIFEQQPTNTQQVGPSCPADESESDVASTHSESANIQTSNTASLQPFPMTDPLIKGAIGPLLDVSDPKLLAYAKEVAAQEAEPADEKAIRKAMGEDGVRNYRDMKNDLADAHRMYEATGQIPQTRHSFSPIEIQTGKMMTQSQRYDAFMEKIGKNPMDVAFFEKDINVDKTYLTDAEFHAQHTSRIKDVQEKLHDECHTGAMRFQPLAQPDCERKILEKNTSPQYMAERDEVHRKDRALYEKTNAYTEQLANTGAAGTLARAAGRLGGYVAGYASGGEEKAEDWANQGEKYLGAIGNLFDAATPVVAGMSERSRVEAYRGSAGLEVQREGSGLMESAPSINSHETQPGSFHESVEKSGTETIEVQNSKSTTASGPPEPSSSPASVSRTLVDTNTAINIDNARRKAGSGEKLTSQEQEVLNEFKDKDVWVAHAGHTELEAKGGTKETFKIATDVVSSTKQERDAIYNDLESASVGGGDKKGEKDRILVRQILLTPAPAGQTNTFSTADAAVIKGLFRLAQIPDPRPGHAGEILEPSHLDGKSVAGFLRDVLKQDTFDVTIQGHRLTVRPLQ